MQPVDLRVVPWHFVLVQTEYLLSCGCERLMLWQKHWERWPRARGWLQGRCHSALSHLLSDLETVPTVSHHVGLFPGDRSWHAFGKRFGGHVKKSLIKSPSILFSVQMLPLWKKGPSPSSWVCLGRYILSAVCYQFSQQLQNTAFNNSTFNSGKLKVLHGRKVMWFSSYKHVLPDGMAASGE